MIEMSPGRRVHSAGCACHGFVPWCHGDSASACLHARSPNGDFHTSLLPANVVGVYNAFEAAAISGCKRIIFASSVHAMLGYKGDWGSQMAGEATDNTNPPNPPNIYGVRFLCLFAYMAAVGRLCRKLLAHSHCTAGDQGLGRGAMQNVLEQVCLPACLPACVRACVRAFSCTGEQLAMSILDF